MPWFAWAWLIAMAIFCGGIAYCAWDVRRIMRRITSRTPPMSPGRVVWWATGILPTWRFCRESCAYARDAWRYEGWGRAGDPRNDRPHLNKREWRARRKAGARWPKAGR